VNLLSQILHLCLFIAESDTLLLNWPIIDCGAGASWPVAITDTSPYSPGAWVVVDFVAEVVPAIMEATKRCSRSDALLQKSTYMLSSRKAFLSWLVTFSNWILMSSCKIT